MLHLVIPRICSVFTKSLRRIWILEKAVEVCTHTHTASLCLSNKGFGQLTAPRMNVTLTALSCDKGSRSWDTCCGKCLKRWQSKVGQREHCKERYPPRHAEPHHPLCYAGLQVQLLCMFFGKAKWIMIETESNIIKESRLNWPSAVKTSPDIKSRWMWLVPCLGRISWACLITLGVVRLCQCQYFLPQPNCPTIETWPNNCFASATKKALTCSLVINRASLDMCGRISESIPKFHRQRPSAVDIEPHFKTHRQPAELALSPGSGDVGSLCSDSVCFKPLHMVSSQNQEGPESRYRFEQSCLLKQNGFTAHTFDWVCRQQREVPLDKVWSVHTKDLSPRLTKHLLAQQVNTFNTCRTNSSTA